MTDKQVKTKKIIALLIIVVAAYLGLDKGGVVGRGDASAGSSDIAILRAYEQELSDIQVTGSGTVVKVLADDNRGSRHQRFLLETSTGQTLLVAHNIDLAPRIDTLREGDDVAFNGEYEWNDRGGVIHWTHHDPQGHHEAGWLTHEGRKYQ